MAYPKTQYVLARKRGRKTQYFYAEKLKDLLPRVKQGEEFQYFKIERGKTFNAALVGETLATKWAGF